MGAPDPDDTGPGAVEAALYPACGLAATVVGPFAGASQLPF